MNAARSRNGTLTVSIMFAIVVSILVAIALLACGVGHAEGRERTSRSPGDVGHANETHLEGSMPPDSPATPHRILWADLATPDDSRAAAFYDELFGWKAVRRTAGGGEYATFERDGRAVASAYRLPRAAVDQGVPAHWIPYVSTPDVDATAAQVERLGGRVLVPPTTYPGLARIAVIAGPDGALLGLWQADRTEAGKDEPAQ